MLVKVREAVAGGLELDGGRQGSKVVRGNR